MKACVLPHPLPVVQASFDGTLPVVQTKKEREKMTEATPKIEGAKKFHRSTRAAGLIKKEFITKVLGLESHTFDIGNVKYAAKYKKMVDVIANHIQRKYKGGADIDIAKAIEALSLSTLQVPGYPNAKTGETAVNPGDIYIWQQDVAVVKN